MAGILRVVNDTVIWLSALYFAGETVKIVKLIEDKSIISVTSEFILQEIKRKLVEFGTPEFAANGTITYISSISEIVPLKGQDFGLRDPADNQVLQMRIFSGPYSWPPDHWENMDVKLHELNGFVAWTESGCHVYAWRFCKFFTADIYSCKKFSMKKTLNFTKNFWKSKDMVNMAL